MRKRSGRLAGDRFTPFIFAPVSVPGTPYIVLVISLPLLFIAIKAIRIGAISLSLLAVVNGKYLNKIE